MAEFTYPRNETRNYSPAHTLFKEQIVIEHVRKKRENDGKSHHIQKDGQKYDPEDGTLAITHCSSSLLFLSKTDFFFKASLTFSGTNPVSRSP